MKKLYYLINYEVRAVAKIASILMGSMLLLQCIFFLFIVNVPRNQYLRFEELLGLAGVPLLFYIFLFGMLVVSALILYRGFIGGKSFYALMTLPQDRIGIFISKGVAAILSLCMFWTMQLLSVFTCYGLYMASSYNVPKVHNALLLAFTRSEFLRMILPQEAVDFFMIFLIACSLALFALYVTLCERTRRYVLVFFLGGILLWTVFQALPLYQREMNQFILIALLLLINGIIISRSIHLLNKSMFG